MTASQSIEAGTAETGMAALGEKARAAAAVLAGTPEARKNAALSAAADAVRAARAEILKANAEDVAGARARNLSAAMIDRLALDAGRIEAMAGGLDDIAAFADPIGAVIAQWERPNGLRIQRVRVPLGVIGVIYVYPIDESVT